MNPATWFIIVSAIGALLVVSVFRQLAVDRFDALALRLGRTSRLVSRGKLVDGNHRRNVLLALTDSAFIYESSDGQSSFDRQWIREVEYENEKSVGIDNVLRLRCFSRTVEFVLSEQVLREWQAVLPAYAEIGARP
ncbi:MAG TPA: hypothetical protein VF980_12815 [Thermoanaerobaculia bacterium]